MSASFRAVLFWVVALLAVFVLYSFFKSTAHQTKDLNYTQFVKKIEEGTVVKVTITGKETLSITLHGDLAGIVGLAAKAKGPLDASDPMVECTKLVAGAGNHREFALPPIPV